MGEFQSMIKQRLDDAYTSLRTAQADDDEFLVDSAQAEIDDLRRLAANNGVDLAHCPA